MPVKLRTIGRPLVLSTILILVSFPLASMTLWNWLDMRGNALFRIDYTLYLASSLQGLNQGWHYLYDLGAQRRTLDHFFPGLWWFPNVYTPALSILMVPFTRLPLA